MTRPLREVIANIISPGAEWLQHTYRETAFRKADEILAALPQTEGSETVREALEPFARIYQKKWDMAEVTVPMELMKAAADALNARQALALPVDGWRPMSEAPKDGTEILGVVDSNRIVVQWVISGFWGEHWFAPDGGPNGGGTMNVKPTHWMPLPAPPAPDRGGEDG